MAEPAIQYVQNEEGETTAVIVPIDVWREMSSELETQYLMRSRKMRERIEQALSDRSNDIPAEEVFAKLGLSSEGL